MKLYIYPCFDSLLYFPVYLTLEAIRHNATLTEAVDVHLEHPDKPGDDIAIRRLLDFKPQGDSIAVAVADPMLAFEYNHSIVENAKSGQQRLKIIATFIDKIALWAIGLKHHLKKKLGATAFDQLIRGRRPDLSAFEGWTTAFWQDGRTTRYLVENCVIKKLHGYSVPLSGYGDAEVKALTDKKIDLVFTNTPWLASEDPEVRVIDFFNPAPFPFSSLITTEQMLVQESASKILLTFLNHLRAAVTIASRYPDETAQCLINKRTAYKNYRLSELFDTRKATSIIARATMDVVHTGCLCEQLTNTWTAWDYALETKFGKNYLDRPDEYKGIWTTTIQNMYVAVMRSELPDYAAKIDGFLERELRPVIMSFLRSYSGAARTLDA